MIRKICLLICSLLLATFAFAQTTPLPPVHPASGDTSVFAEVMPEFPVEKGTFSEYLRNNIKYPATEKRKRKQGTVWVSFVVEKNGSITNVKLARGVEGAPGLDKEALRVISAMSPWTPGSMDGKPVRIEITQPIKFVLQ